MLFAEQMNEPILSPIDSNSIDGDSATPTSDCPHTRPKLASLTTPTWDNPKVSYSPICASPPPVTEPYSTENALDDLPGVSYALALFLASHMVELEDYCHESDPQKYAVFIAQHWILTSHIFREHWYFASGYGMIQCVKGLMSFEDEVYLSVILPTVPLQSHLCARIF